MRLNHSSAGVRRTPVFPRRPRAAGFTMVELLTVITILGLLTALLLPTIQSALESGRQNSCRNHLRNLSTGLVGYANRTGSFPGYINALEREDGAPYHDPITKRAGPVSWVVPILPDLDRGALYAQWRRVPVDETEGNDSAAAGSAVFIADTQVYLDFLVCPSDTPAARSGTPTSYVVNSGLQDYSPPPGPASGEPPPRRRIVDCGCAMCQASHGSPPPAPAPSPTSTPPADRAANGVFFDHYHSSSLVGAGAAATPKITMSSESIRDPKDRTILLTENVDAFNYTTDLRSAGSSAAGGEVFRAAEAQFGCVWVPNVNVDASVSPPRMDPPRQSMRINIERGGGDGLNFDYCRPSSNHPEGVNMAFAGLNVVFVRDSMSYFVYAKLMASNDARASTAGRASSTEMIGEVFRNYSIGDSEINP